MFSNSPRQMADLLRKRIKILRNVIKINVSLFSVLSLSPIFVACKLAKVLLILAFFVLQRYLFLVVCEPHLIQLLYLLEFWMLRDIFLLSLLSQRRLGLYRRDESSTFGNLILQQFVLRVEYYIPSPQFLLIQHKTANSLYGILFYYVQLIHNLFSN